MKKKYKENKKQLSSHLALGAAMGVVAAAAAAIAVGE